MAAKKRRELLTATDLAGFCQVDLKTIHNWCDSGKLPHFRTPGRHLRFKREDIVTFLRKYGYPIPLELKGIPRVFVLAQNERDAAVVMRSPLAETFQFVHHSNPLMGVARAVGGMGDRADALVIIPPFAGFSCDGLPSRVADGGLELPCVGFILGDRSDESSDMLRGAHAVIMGGPVETLGDALSRILGINA